ncbi:MAG: rRNA pseudouridine synthase [Deltaproteobacteria bacterium]|nr:MAG: rRNA pseudouridine synthase [Deltaproteobacteria bacterium]
MPSERLQKFLSRAGVASRRAAEEMIQAGRVMLNGRMVRELGLKIDPDKDVVKVDGRRVQPEALVTVMLHKPYGYLSTTKDPQSRRVVTDLLGEKGPRLYPVGRLDYDATGLLLLTNDGELAQRLTHPRYQVPRTYRLTVTGEVSRETLRTLAAGVEVDHREVAAAVQVRKSAVEKTVLEITVWEGRYHLLKRLLAQVGHPVLKLKRIAFGPLRLGRLPRGAHRVLSREEVAALNVGVKRK